MEIERFRLNAPFVASQVIDGEVILINFESGAYYSAGRSGAAVLALIEAGHSVEEVVASLAGRHGADREKVAAAIDRFVADLADEALIVAAGETAGAADGAPSECEPSGDPFEAPSLEKFDDLQDILLLDPIHDGGAPAWPGSTGGSRGTGD